MSNGQLFKGQECDQEFTLNKNLFRHVNTVHGNDPRKDNEARKDGLLKCVDIHTFEGTGVGFDHQVASPAEYVSLAMEATHKHKQLTSDKFLEVTGLFVFQCIRDNFGLFYTRDRTYMFMSQMRWCGGWDFKVKVIIKRKT